MTWVSEVVTPAFWERENRFSAPQTGPFLDRGGAVHQTAAYDTLAEALAAAAGDGLGVCFSPGVIDVAANLTVNVGSVPAMGAVLRPASGVTITFEGAVSAAPNLFWLDPGAGGAFVFQNASLTTVHAGWFGLSEDATGEDNRAALVAAHASLQQGMTLALPPGVFWISDTLWFTKPAIAVVGCRSYRDDSTGTIATYTGGTQIWKTGDFDGLVFAAPQGILHNILVKGQYAYNGSYTVPEPAGTGCGIIIETKYLSIQHIVGIYNALDNIVIRGDVDPVQPNTHFGVFVGWVGEYGGRHGLNNVAIENNNHTNLNKYLSCRMGRNVGDGWHITAGSYSTYDTCEGSYNGGYGIHFDEGGANSTLAGCHTEGNHGGDSTIDDGDGLFINNTAGINIVGGTFTDGGTGTATEVGISETGTVQRQSKRFIDRITSRGQFSATSHLSQLNFVAESDGNSNNRAEGITFRSQQDITVDGTTYPVTFYGTTHMQQTAGTPVFNVRVTVPQRVDVDGVPTAVNKVALSLDADPASGATGVQLLVNRADTVALAPLRVGPDGTGPAGVGRQFYTSTDATEAASPSALEYSVGNASTTKTIDWRNGNYQYVTLTGNCTFTFINPVAGVRYRLDVAYSGAYAPTWPSSVRFAGSTTPTPISLAGRKDKYFFDYCGTESLYNGAQSPNFLTT